MTEASFDDITPVVSKNCSENSLRKQSEKSKLTTAALFERPLADPATV